MFDKLDLFLKSGNGGNGVVHFRREKFVPYGGPDGGDGGRGGDIRFVATSGVTDFRAFRNKGVYKAGDGSPGSGKNKHGKDGEDLVLVVPIGTVIMEKKDSGESVVLADLRHDGQEVTLASGGKGGLGNAHYASSTRQTPRIAQTGAPGVAIHVMLDLRLIADIGIIGYPNVGKSSLLAAASAAKPEIADYPFTTKEAVLGVINIGYESFVMAEIPGLIAGAAQGRGLGHDFLRQAGRTSIFLHLINGASPTPVADMIAVNNELSLFSPALAQKPQIVAVNKIDLPEVKARIPEIRRLFQEAKIDAVFISAVSREGVDELITQVWAQLRALLRASQPEIETPVKIFQPQPKELGFTVSKEGGVFLVDAPALSRMISDTGEMTPELVAHVRLRLVKAGLDRILRRAGAKPGDKIRCGNVEWEWFT